MSDSVSQGKAYALPGNRTKNLKSSPMCRNQAEEVRTGLGFKLVHASVAAQVSVGRYGNAVFERTLCYIACRTYTPFAPTP